MAQPRPAASKIQPGQVHDIPSQESTTQLHPGDGIKAKKRRGDAPEAPKKRHRGGRGGLCELNFDELYIIFAYIYPMDLLNLARTCKSLRGILMHKSSLFLWKTALRQIEGLPSCPADLTEPEYTNLVFYNHCHSCGKPVKAAFWNMRRRYCKNCKAERLCRITYCDEFFSEIDDVLPHDKILVDDYFGRWVDRNQFDTFLHEYHSSSDKTTFLNERRRQCEAISLHASECETWQQRKGRVHRFDLEILRKERRESIFERLKQRGYGPEIAYVGEELIEKSYKYIFKKHTPLTDSEWDRLWPKWGEIMNNFRLQRLKATIYQPRLRLLASEYESFVMRPSPESPVTGFLPHMVDLCRFPLFRNIIKVSEDTRLDDKPFASAFAQLPVLVDEWTRKLDSELATLVKIPSCLSSQIVSGDHGASAGPSQSGSVRLQLACAVFHVGGTGAFAYPEVLSVAVGSDVMFPSQDTDRLSVTGVSLSSVLCNSVAERTGSIHDLYGLQFLDEAPYIIYACGMDPNVATADDMDRRDARLRCLCCGGRTLVMNWKHAIWHARFYHCISLGLAPLSEAPRWQLINDECIYAIHTVEQMAQKTFSPDWTRCLLCRPCVGDAMLYDNALRHLNQCHGLESAGIQEGIHYKPVGIRDVCVVEMIHWQIWGQVAFRVLDE